MRALIFFLALAAWAQPQKPLEKPLAEFDRMTATLGSARLVGDPIIAGTTTVVPYAAVQFSLGSGALAIAAGGGMGGKVVPLGVLVVEGDDVRMEPIPEKPEPPSAMRQLVQALLDRKITFMVNGVNLGNANATVQDLAAALAAVSGQTNVVVNGLNLGNLNPPKATAPKTAESPKK